MDITPAEIGYFNRQVSLSLASFNVSQEDTTAVENSLNSVFGVRCAPPTPSFANQTAELQSICIADTCPLSANDTCASYAKAVKPAVANDTLVANTTFATTTSSSSVSTRTTTRPGSTSTMTAQATVASTSKSKGGAQPTAASGMGVGGAVIVGGIFAILL